MTTLITSRSDSVAQHLNPLDLLRALWRNRNLIFQFTRREVESRYRGSFLGLFWSFVNPLTTLLIYTFAFGVVLHSRWPQARTDSLGEFAVVLLCGIAVFNVFSESANRATTTIITVPNYVKKVVFPLEVLPVSVVGAALFHFVVTLAIVIVTDLFVFGLPPWTLALVPLVALPLIFLSLGMAWFLASLGVFVRDISYTVNLIVQVLFFLSPILYPLESIPEPFRSIIQINPMTPLVQYFRDVIFASGTLNIGSYVVWLLVSAVIMQLGYAWFMKTKKAFADVI
jgi:lipopolysaccharide transport system permease protein